MKYLYVLEARKKGKRVWGYEGTYSAKADAVGDISSADLESSSGLEFRVIKYKREQIVYLNKNPKK